MSEMKEINGMKLLPPNKDVCQECATKHEPSLPHNAQSLYYQYSFYADHQRFPTWKDALAHCTEEMKNLWTTQLSKYGIEVK